MSHYSTSMKYEIPEEAFADPLNPTVEEVYTWANSPANVKPTSLHGAVIVFDEVGSDGSEYKYIWRTIDTGDEFSILSLKGLPTMPTIEDDGTPLPSRDTINFIGDGLIASDNGTNTEVTLDNTLSVLAVYNTDGLLVQTALDTFEGRTIVGTLDKITITNGDGVLGNPTLDIASTYLGQISITTLGTIITGEWNGTEIPLAHGGTGSVLVDPGADRILFWDDSAGQVTWLSIDPSLTLNGTTLSVTGGTNMQIAFGQTGVAGLTSENRLLWNYTNDNIIVTKTGGLAATNTFSTIAGINVYNEAASLAAMNVLVSSNGSSVHRGYIVFNRSTGTLASPTAVGLNYWLGGLVMGGHDGTTFQHGAGMEAFVDGAVSAGSVPARLSFLTGSNTATRVERLTIYSSGVVKIVSLAGSSTRVVTADPSGNLGSSTPASLGIPKIFLAEVYNGVIPTMNVIINTTGRTASFDGQQIELSGTFTNNYFVSISEQVDYESGAGDFGISKFDIGWTGTIGGRISQISTNAAGPNTVKIEIWD